MGVVCPKRRGEAGKFSRAIFCLKVRSLVKMKLFRYHKLNERVVFREGVGIELVFFCWTFVVK